MYLKTLTLRGFKSFASATTLSLEPGITCVVGPNGSGKSNVVDALAWVMGEQGARNLRGGSMPDVIFSGTEGAGARKPLGRAEVSLTIDNTDGAIPIDYTEVTITRRLFRAGGSEYEINGERARLADIQELLNDSGLGKEMHVIVGQGRLDDILHADPQDRRGFIEEAAGVLKHRRRKDAAIRKLTGLQTNLDRLTDLRAELADRLGPLGRQAGEARKAAHVQSVLREARARLLADDLVRARARLETPASAEAQAARVAALEQQLTGQQAAHARLGRELTDHDRALEHLRSRAARVAELRARTNGLVDRARDRARLLSTTGNEGTADEQATPESLRRRADLTAGEAHDLEAQVETDRTALQEAEDRRDDLAERLAAEETRVNEERARISRRLRERADLTGAREASTRTVDDLRERIGTARAEKDRATARLTDLEAALDGARTVAAEANTRVTDRAAVVDTAETALETARSDRQDVRTEREALESENARISGRLEALRSLLAPPAATEAVLAGGRAGVLGPAAGVLRVVPGHERAVAALLGDLPAGVLVDDHTTAAAVLTDLDAEAPVDLLVVGAAPDTSGDGSGAECGPTEGTGAETDGTDGAPGQGASGASEEADFRPDTDLRTLVDTRVPGLAPELDRLLAGIRTASDLTAARAGLAAGDAEAYVLADGTLATATRVLRGSGAEGRRLGAARTVEELGDRRAELEARIGELGEDLAVREATVRAAQTAAEEARSTHQDARSRAQVATARVTHAEEDLGRPHDEVARAGDTLADMTDRLARAEAAATRAAEALAGHEATPDTEPDTPVLQELRAEHATAAAGLVEARVALRVRTDRVAFLHDRVAGLRRRATEVEAARERAAARARARAVLAERARRVAEAALEESHRLAAEADRVTAVLETGGTTREGIVARREEAVAAREATREELDALRESAHRARLEAERHRMKHEELARRAQEETGLGEEDLVERHGPHLLVPPLDVEPPAEDATAGAPVPYVRADVEKIAQKARKRLEEIGQVNPLALEEYTALRERHDYLQGQIDDVEIGRQDLLSLVEDVDAHVRTAFASAFEDTAAQFTRVFATLFPGGEGRLTLTDPADMLTTGVEVTARPAGKRVGRLSLLSGGERSLVALALLVAIFQARPSPFYVLDEVEAALDDVNLGRLLQVFEDLGRTSQLLVVTHQKRTMGVADALYGVTMRGDGISTVISQRIPRERFADGDAPVDEPGS
ncbi:chromosome segregation SMC family protein [Brevibacterium litoralis]|uniref:chromosome segregation SMC family protein n=1 Tax=Brevibacterium litoralis TaxID=3138935 RepID=UPI0032ECCBF9